MTGPRTQSERDALTIEIVFALVTAGLLAAVLYVAVASPALFGDLDRAHERAWQGAAFAVAIVGFAIRLVRALWLFSRQKR